MAAPKENIFLSMPGLDLGHEHKYAVGKTHTPICLIDTYGNWGHPSARVPWKKVGHFAKCIWDMQIWSSEENYPVIYQYWMHLFSAQIPGCSNNDPKETQVCVLRYLDRHLRYFYICKCISCSYKLTHCICARIICF